MEQFETESAILLAISEGNLAESGHLDVKRDTGSSNSARAETARDLASFAIYGGVLLIGIDEDKSNRTLAAAPVALVGAAEKLEQIAANRIDPPLFVRVRDVPSAADPSIGYLVVEIPPSSQAPHMVGGRYYARADRTKRQLTDAEVVALHAAREPAERRVRAMLSEWASRPVVPADREPRNGHLDIVGMPLGRIATGSFLDVSRAPNNTQAFNLTTFAGEGVPGAFMNFSPTIRGANNWVPRRDGSSYTSLQAGVPRLRPADREETLVDFELRDDGSFGILMGRLAQLHPRDFSVVFDFPAVGYAWRAVRIAQWISTHTGYRGAWGLGFRADGMAEQLSFELVEHAGFFETAHPYSADVYETTTTANLAELEDAPEAVVERLIGGFLRGLGSYSAYRRVLESLPS